MKYIKFVLLVNFSFISILSLADDLNPKQCNDLGFVEKFRHQVSMQVIDSQAFRRAAEEILENGNRNKSSRKEIEDRLNQKRNELVEKDGRFQQCKKHALEANYAFHAKGNNSLLVSCSVSEEAKVSAAREDCFKNGMNRMAEWGCIIHMRANIDECVISSIGEKSVWRCPIRSENCRTVTIPKGAKQVGGACPGGYKRIELAKSDLDLFYVPPCKKVEQRARPLKPQKKANGTSIL